MSVSPPDYEYVDKSGHSRINKSRFQRKYLPKVFGDSFDHLKSERENCEAQGYFQIYDCGLTRWVWK